MLKLNKFEWLMVFGVSVAAAMSIYRGDPDALLSSFAAITGIICVIMCSKGKRSSYVWGFVNVLAYALLAYRATFYGEVILNALYFMPTQFIGWYFWSKHLNSEVNEVKSKVMTLPEIIAWSAITLTSMYGVARFLEFIGTGQFYAGSVSLTLSLIANVLMVKRYAEQWPIWIFVNVASIYMWFQWGDMVQVTMWSMYLVNAIYGWYLWVDRKNKYNRTND